MTEPRGHPPGLFSVLGRQTGERPRASRRSERRHRAGGGLDFSFPGTSSVGSHVSEFGPNRKRGGKMPAMNRLAQEQSPYLLQHAANPVDWWPWCPEAFEQARVRDVPVLISICYSACHWCHVMAHESFEDAEVAEVMNTGFVSIKVDREERPDIDAIYMEAVQLVSGNGGWPMTVLGLPDGRPFWAGTYLPKADLVALLARVSDLWASRRRDIETDAARLVAAVRQGARLSSPAEQSSQTGVELLGSAAQALSLRLDPEWGGFGNRPKFPEPASLELLAQHWWRSRDDRSLQALRLTLDAMSSGGIYDHLGGGFARYSTDRRWLVPHFEKMLYDNALLLSVYTHAWQLTRSERYRQVAQETAAYLLRPPMRLPEGAWASAEDADSEGEEGRFYTWALDELEEVGGQAAARWYGATEKGNFKGRNILWRPGVGELARPPEIENARSALFERREQRPRPGLDAKVLCEWNSMAVVALATAGAALGQPGWVRAAAETGDVLLRHLRRSDGRWLRSWRAGFGSGANAPGTAPAGSRSPALACAGDYAWLVRAFTCLGETTGQRSWTEAARETADALLELFWDEDEGAFFTCGSDSEQLVARIKDLHDGAIPSANASAATALARLGELTGQPRYREAASQVVEALSASMAVMPSAFCGTVPVASYLDGPRRQVVVASSSTELVEPVWDRYLPDTVLAWGERYESPLWEGRDGPGARGKAFVCVGYSCRLPVATAADLSRTLDGDGTRGPAIHQ